MSTGPNDLEQRAITRARQLSENMLYRAKDGRDGRDGRDGGEGQLIERPDPELVQRVEWIANKVEMLSSRLIEFGARLDDIEARPAISEESIRQLNEGLNGRFNQAIEQKVNERLGDIRSRIVTLERRAETPAITGESDSVRLRKLGEVVDRLADYVERYEVEADRRHDDLEQKYAEIAEHIAAVQRNMLTVTGDVMRMKGRIVRALNALDHDDAA